MARIFSLSFVTLLLVFQQKLCTGELLIIDAIGIISGVMGIIDIVWDNSSKVDSHQTVIQQFNNYHIHHQIKQLSDSIINVNNQSIDESNNRQTLKQFLSELSDEVSIIEKWYEEMLYYNKTVIAKKTAREEIPQATAKILKQENGSSFHLNKIYALFLNGEGHILKLLGSLKKGFKNTCSSDNSLQSVQQMYLKLYSLVTLAGAKTYQTILTAVELIRKYEPGSSYQHAVKEAKENIINKQKEIGRKFKHSLKVSSREVWRCDPEHDIDDQTFIELKYAFRKHLSCKDYRNPTFYSRFVDFGEDNEICQTIPICDILSDCNNTFELNTSQVLDICYATDPWFISGTKPRLFYYAEKRNKSNADVIIDHYGHDKTCTERDQKLSTLTFKERELYTCTCELNYYKEYISLKPVFSNIDENRVVTGARLVRNEIPGYTIGIEIQEGTLGPMATIVNGSVSWVSNDRLTIDHFPTSNLFIDTYLNDHYTIQWDGRRQFTLTDIEADKGSVVVGLQFGMKPENPENGITIILHTRAFDFETGKLSQVETAKQFFASEDLYIEDLDIPTLAPGKNVALTEKNKRIYLTTTGMKQDLGQTVVPFFDMQEVTTTIPTPMSGVGLYYKRYEGYGGFLGLKLLTYDFLKHFNSNISKGVDLNEE